MNPRLFIRQRVMAARIVSPELAKSNSARGRLKFTPLQDTDRFG
jgi:hypothetical protein